MLCGLPTGNIEKETGNLRYWTNPDKRFPVSFFTADKWICYDKNAFGLYGNIKVSTYSRIYGQFHGTNQAVTHTLTDIQLITQHCNSNRFAGRSRGTVECT